jgi:hypothetical protein
MLEHKDLLHEINRSIDQAFEEAGKEFINVKKEKYAYFSETKTKSKNEVSIDKATLKNMVKFLVEHVFIQCGDKIFQQIIGIPMGTNCAPFLANLYLFAKEFHWINEMYQKQETRAILFKYFRMCFRYLDDLFAGNNNFQMDNYKEVIYPIELKCENTLTAASANFLQLKITVHSGRFLMDVHDKRLGFKYRAIKFPQACSKVSFTPCHNVFFGQLISFNTICENYTSFVRAAKRDFHTLIVHNKLDVNTLKNITRKFLERYPVAAKFQVEKAKIVEDVSNI